MKKFKVLLIFTICFAIFCLKTSYTQEEKEVILKSPPAKFNWNSYGQKIINNAPQNVKDGTELDKAKYITTQVGSELANQGITANTCYVDRKILKGDTIGTCGDVSDKLYEAFKGAGITSVPILGEKSKDTSSQVYRALTDPLDVNQDHGAVAVYINGKVNVFDLWIHAVTNNKSFTKAGASTWNGLTLGQWEKAMKDAGYVSFSTLSADNNYGEKLHNSLNGALKSFILENSPLTEVPEEIRIDAGSSWEGILPASKTIELKGRIVYSKPAGGQYVLEIKVNDIKVAGSLLNKGLSFKFKDGRTFSYKNANSWMLFYSPNFSANNSKAGEGYQVLTNSGEAYRYKWNISEQVENFSKMKVTIINNGGVLKLQIVVRDLK